MIARLMGVVAEIYADGKVVIDVNGVGYEVQLSSIDIENIVEGETVKLATYFHVRENSQELFGFTDSASKKLFEKLISVNGVGPKGAMAIMGLGERSQIQSAIASGNTAFISGASGVGKKVAERVVLDLKDKVGVFSENATLSQKSDDALSALTSLGFSSAQASEVLSRLDSSLSTEEKVKAALKELS